MRFGSAPKDVDSLSLNSEIDIAVERRLNRGRREEDALYHRLMKVESTLSMLAERTTHHAGELDALKDAGEKLMGRVVQNTEASWALKNSLLSKINWMLGGLISALLAVGGTFLILLFQVANK